MPSLLEALERKYFADDDCPLGDDDGGGVADGGGHCAADAISVRSDKCSSSPPTSGGLLGKRPVSIFIPRLPPLLSVPELLVLNDCDIDCAGDFASIKEKCQRVRELDLAQNKLQDWQEVCHILQHMPRVEFLNLSKNQLCGPIAKLCAPSFSNLRGIVLNGTFLDWRCLDVLLENLPLLEELHLSLNNYSEVLIDAADSDSDHSMPSAEAENGRRGSCSAQECDCCQQATGQPLGHRCRTVAAHKSLRSLHFTGNPIESWQEVCRLGRVFPSLENLVLADCPISAIHTRATSSPTEAEESSAQSAAPSCCCERNATLSSESEAAADEDCPHRNFLNLSVLNLSYANIDTWDDIDRLARFPKLRNLRIKNLPLWERLECTEHERRQLLIARLPNVALLNGGGVISADEREDSERAFIRHYMEKPEAQRPARYAELLTKHGQLDPLVDVNLKPDKRIKVFLCHNERREPRLVDVHRTVADLKVKLEKIVGLPANKMRLYYLDQDYKEFGPEEMRFPNKLLYSYNIQPGDEIIIDQKK